MEPFHGESFTLLQHTEDVFLFAFSLEVLLKVIALGFFVGKNTYTFFRSAPLKYDFTETQNSIYCSLSKWEARQWNQYVCWILQCSYVEHPIPM